MPNNSYSVLATCAGVTGSPRTCSIDTINAQSFRVRIRDNANADQDNFFSFTVHATNAPAPKGGTGADAWANTAGASGNTLASFNLSCTRLSEGYYQYTFGTSMPSGNYAVLATCADLNQNSDCVTLNYTATGFQVRTYNAAGTAVGDRAHSVVVHATNAQLPNTVTQEQIDNALSNSCAAWGKINGTDGALLGGLNVTTSKTGSGEYAVVFDTRMPNDNYSVVATCLTARDRNVVVSDQTATGFTLNTKDENGSAQDLVSTMFTVHATNAPAPKGGTGADAWARVDPDGNTGSNVYNLTAVRNSDGMYTLTFGTAMPTGNYSVIVSPTDGGNGVNVSARVRNQTASSFQVFCTTQGSTTQGLDSGFSVAVHATNATLPSPLTQDDLLFVDGRNASTGTQRFNVIKAQTSDSVLTAANNNSLVEVAVSSGSSFTDVTGIRTNIRASNGTNSAYSFYAAGDAPNFFNGTTYFRNSVNIANNSEPANNAAFMNAGGNLDLRIARASSAGTQQLYYMRLFRGTTGSAASNQQIAYIRSENLTNIRFDSGPGGDFSSNSDYRIKQDIAPLGSSVDIIKALNPVSYKFTNGDPKTYQGFIAHELQEQVPAAVLGIKDDTETIGTYTDADGAVQTEVTEPEAIPYGATWEQTGTRDVYQGVNVTKLIPVLTKALQEALTRIEELESNTLQPLYSTFADLPDASEHHGKTAHVHDEGALYFAHAGNWVKLQNA